MMQPVIIIAVIVIIAIQCNAFDDGKYTLQKYRGYDDGKYYRPINEGKYIPGDEGKYTYVYKNNLYPAFPYVHEDGPQGSNNNYRGPNGGDGRNGGNGPDGGDESNRIDYIGRKIYAERYPYVHSIIDGLLNKYVSSDYFGDIPEGSAPRSSKVYADKERAVKCHFVSPDDKDTPINGEEFVTQYPPRTNLNKSEKLGSFYGFKGSKILNTVNNALSSKIKLEYEVFVRVVEINE